MQRSRHRIVLGSAAALVLFAGGLIVAFSVESRGDVRTQEKLWTESPGAKPVDPARPQSFSELAKRASPAVVNLSTSRTVKRISRGGQRGHRGRFFDFFERFFGELPKHFKNRGVGTGFIIHPQGYILTNHHVIEGAEEIKVKLLDERELSARVVGSDERTDLALLKAETSDPLPVLALGDSDKLEVGEWVVAIGNPFGLHHTVTAGIVSAKGRRGINPGGRDLQYTDFIQTDASINPGNSGGPLINLRGDVVGINTAINAAGQGIGFAIPVNMVKVLIPQLKERGRVVRSWIGIHIQPVTRALAKSFGMDEPRGALVAEVVPGAPAAKARLQPGDIILGFNGQSIRKHNDLLWLASTAGVGAKVSLKVLRQGREAEVPLTLAAHPSDSESLPKAAVSRSPGQVQGLGVTVTDVTPRVRDDLGLENTDGALVTEVQEGSEAAQAGVQANDVILKVNLKPVRNAAELERAVSAIRAGEPVNLYLRREKSHLWVAFVRR
jgi:serine protease Do